MEINLPSKQVKEQNVNELLDSKIKATTNEKEAIDFLATKTALQQDGTVEKIVNEKTEELKNDAEAKRIKSETDRINEEVLRVKAEKEKEIAELDKVISTKRKEVEQLQADSDRAEAYFETNKDILSYIGIRRKKTLNVMRRLMWLATIIFAIVQVMFFPATFAGKAVETLVDIVGGICGKLKYNASKILVAFGVVVLIGAIVFLAYYYGGKLIDKI